MRRLIVAVLLPCLMSTNVEAHAFLLKADPGVGSTVGRAPDGIRLQFSEPVELAFSGVEITDQSGHAVPPKPLRFGNTGHTMLVVDTPMLGAGSYRVKWHVVSVDTHRTDGDFTFTVKP